MYILHYRDEDQKFLSKAHDLLLYIIFIDQKTDDVAQRLCVPTSSISIRDQPTTGTIESDYCDQATAEACNVSNSYETSCWPVCALTTCTLTRVGGNVETCLTGKVVFTIFIMRRHFTAPCMPYRILPLPPLPPPTPSVHTTVHIFQHVCRSGDDARSGLP